MPLRWSLFAPMAALLALGCSRPPADRAALEPGDEVRPEVSFAPDAPWPAEARVSIGVLLRVERPGGESHHLRDADVPLEQVKMSARVTYLDGDRPLRNPDDVPLVHDC